MIRMEFGDLFPFQLMSMLDSFLAWPVRKTIHYTAWPIPSPWNQQVSCLDSNSIVRNWCPPMSQNHQLPSKSYVMHLKIYQIIFPGRWETLRCHVSPNILKNIPRPARKYTLIRRFFLLSTSSADLFISRESLPNFGVNTDPPSSEYEFSCYELFQSGWCSSFPEPMTL